MDFAPHLPIFETAIRRIYPEINFDTPLVIDPDFDEAYFEERKISYFRSTDDFQSVDFKIKRFRTRFFITGTIDKVSPDHVLSRYNVKTALKIGIKRKGIPEIVQRIDKLRNDVQTLSEEIFKVRREIIELKSFCAEKLGLSTPITHSNNYSRYNYPIAYQDSQNEYVEMAPRV